MLQKTILTILFSKVTQGKGSTSQTRRVSPGRSSNCLKLLFTACADKDVTRSYGEGRPWRSLTFTKSTSAGEETAFPGERTTLKMVVKKTMFTAMKDHNDRRAQLIVNN